MTTPKEYEQLKWKLEEMCDEYAHEKEPCSRVECIGYNKGWFGNCTFIVIGRMIVKNIKV